MEGQRSYNILMPVSEYPILSIEDPFDQDVWEHCAKMTTECGDKMVERQSTKVLQCSSLEESIDAVKMSKRVGWGVMASHRSGETEDTFIVDFPVGLSPGQIKIGAPCRSERLAKYNQLLHIEEELGSEAIYVGANFCKHVEPY